MLEFSHIEMKDKKQTYVLHDVSFHFSSVGLTSICGNSYTQHSYIAHLLAGLRKPEKGKLFYNKTHVVEFNERELALYRANCTASLFCDFQIVEHKSVADNIQMGLEVSKEEYTKMLASWGLVDKEQKLMNELSFLDQVKAVFIRILLRHPAALVVYPDSSFYSKKEWIQLYPYMKRISKEMTVIVIGDENAYPFSDRILEIRNGYIVSDSIEPPKLVVYDVYEERPFRMGITVRFNIARRLRYYHRWNYRVLAFLMLMSIICLSTAMFSTTLDIADIEMMYLNQNKYSTIAVAKHAQGNDGSIYTQSYAAIEDSDVEKLQKEVKGTFVKSYYPQNIEILEDKNAIAQQTIFNSFSLIEATGADDLGAKVYGEYPKTYTEVALTYQNAKHYFGNEVSDSDGSGKSFLGKTITWFDIPLTISGIILQADNNNLTFQMGKYQEGSYVAELGSDSLYVKKGFHKQSILAKQQTFKSSYKRMQDVASSTYYPIVDMSSLQYSTYYSDGSSNYLLMDQVDEQFQKDEVLLSFSAGLKLGYDEVYASKQYTYMTLGEKKQSYEEFTKKWMNKTIKVQAYTSKNIPDNTAFFSKNMKIKGFLYPVSWDFNEKYMVNLGNLYFNRNVIDSFIEPNYRIKELYYHTNNMEDMKEALTYLLKDNTYVAYLSKPMLMQFFVVDLKSMSVLLFIGGGVALLTSIFVLLRLVRETLHYGYKEMSAYYMFGEQMIYIKRMYIQYFIDILSKRILISGIFATLIVSCFVFVIFFKIAMYGSILYNLLLPLGISVAMVLLLIGIVFMELRNKSVVDPALIRIE